MLDRAGPIWRNVPERARDVALEANGERLQAWYYSMGGKPEIAVPLFEDAIRKLRAFLGPEHHITASALGGLAYARLQLGELGEADRLSLEALEMGLKMPATSSDQLAHIRFARGQVLMAQQQWGPARDEFVQAWDLYYVLAPRSFDWKIATLDVLVRACDRLEDGEAKAHWEELRRATTTSGALPEQGGA
jgi:tetratricopeptide (TPR) repeat protein